MKKNISLFIALVLGSQITNAQNVGPDLSYPILYDIINAIPSKSGNLYRSYRGDNNSSNPNGPNSITNFNITRYLPNGVIDSSFGNNGTLSPSEFLIFNEERGSNLYLSSNKAVFKYNFNGTPNIGYGNNGQCVLDFPNNKDIDQVIVNNDESLYVRAENYLLKVLPSGVVDTIFGVKDLGGTWFNFLKTNDNSLIIYQQTNNANEYKISKYTPEGNIDVTFGNQGSILLSYDPYPSYMVSMKVNGLNEIILKTRSVLKKYNANGSRDYSFGNNGEFDVSSLTSAQLDGNNMEFRIDKDNKILFFSRTISPSSFIARITNDGIPDNTFNTNGTSPYYLSPVSPAPFWSVIRFCSPIDNDEYICIVSQRKGLANYQQNVIKLSGHLNSTLSTSEIDLNNVGIYPNPVSDVLNIALGLNEKLEKVNIYSIDGRLVFSGQEEKSNIKFLSSGNYMVEIKTNKNLYSKKIIKK